jgi:flavin-dependent dehydrogenase
MQEIDRNNSDRPYDVVIVGAGPAGSSAAIRLCMAGLRVALIEKKRFPREKLCGEFISPECLKYFEELGVVPEIDRSAGTVLRETIFFTRKGRGISFKSEWFSDHNQTALGLSRAEMDDVLLLRAKKVGVDVHEETTASEVILVEGKAVGIKIRSGVETSAIFAGLIMDASGRSNALTRQFENDVIKRPAKFVAFKTHLNGAILTENACEIYCYNGGYGGCNRVENGLYNLCFIVSAELVKRIGSDPDTIMRQVVCENHRAANVLHNAKVVKPWLAVPIDRFGRAELVPASGLITIGDAAAFIDPFTGSGILLALESAKIAVTAVVLGSDSGFDLEKIARVYKRDYSATFAGRLRVCSGLRHAAFMPWLAETTISLLDVSDNFRKFVTRSTRGSF